MCAPALRPGPPSHRLPWHRYVSALYAQHNVGFSEGVQGRKAWAEPPARGGYGRPKLTKEEQLRYRYTLSLEGNDVATDLKWKLASGSLVLMPPPTKEGWLMEGRLQPWVHYVPLDSPADVAVKLAWCRRNPAWAHGIALNATRYMARFAQPAAERAVISGVLRWFDVKDTRRRMFWAWLWCSLRS